MQHTKPTRRWSELYRLNVVDPDQGKILGQVEDFFVQEGSNAIYALSIHTRLHGNLTLPVTGIKAVEDKRVTVKNAQMLLKAVPPFLSGCSLVSRNVVGEKGKTVGAVNDLILGVEPPSTMRIAAFEVANGASDHHKQLFTTASLIRYDDEHAALIVDDEAAKHLR